MGTLKDNSTLQLRAIRAEKGWSQENVADMLGMSPNGYARIERGETHVSLDKVEEIADTLDVSLPEMRRLPTTVINYGHATGEQSYASGAFNHGHTINIGASNGILEKILERLAVVEAKLAASKQKK